MPYMEKVIYYFHLAIEVWGGHVSLNVCVIFFRGGFLYSLSDNLYHIFHYFLLSLVLYCSDSNSLVQNIHFLHKILCAGGLEVHCKYFHVGSIILVWKSTGCNNSTQRQSLKNKIKFKSCYYNKNSFKTRDFNN